MVGPRSCVPPEDCSVGVCAWGYVRGITNTQMEFSLLFPEKKKLNVCWKTEIADIHWRLPLINPESVLLQVEILSYSLKTMISLKCYSFFFAPESLRDITLSID